MLLLAIGSIGDCDVFLPEQRSKEINLILESIQFILASVANMRIGLHPVECLWKVCTSCIYCLKSERELRWILTNVFLGIAD